MKNPVSKTFSLGSVLLVLALSGCSTYQQPAVIEESEGSVDPGSAEVLIEEQTGPPEPPQILGQAADIPQRPVNSAVEDLLRSGEELYDARDYDAAIAIAERALRIDRLNPRIYLLIAKSYWAKGAYGEASQTARQGLQYSAERSTVRGELERYQ